MRLVSFLELFTFDYDMFYYFFTDMNDLGGTALRLMRKFSPGQKRVYCNPATMAQLREFRDKGCPDAAFNPNKPIGKNTITLHQKEFARRVGVEDWENFGAQAHRRTFCTKLANDPSINITDAMSVARHKSVKTHSGYVQQSKNQAAITRALHNVPIAKAKASASAISQHKPITPANIVNTNTSVTGQNYPTSFQSTTQISPMNNSTSAPSVSITQTVSYLDNYLAQCMPADTTANAPNYLRGFVPGELTTDELFEVHGDNLTADMLVDNNVIDKKTGI